VQTDGLFKILQDLEVNQELHAIDKDYPYWEKFKYMVRRIDYPPELLWCYNKLSREKAISNIKLSGLKGFEFKFNTTGKILKYLHQFDLHLGGILEGRSIIPNDDKNRYLISSIMEEAIASSQLEGAVTTRVIAKQMLRSNRKPRNLSEKMILNNYLTIKKVIELKDKPISREVILELHSIISKGTLKNPDNEGKFRTNNEVNVVEDITGEIFYAPPDYNSIEELIECFCAFANDPNDSDFVHPNIRGIILHFLIGYIHPFMDGNGRTARAIFYWYLMSQGYWLVEYMAISKIIIRGPAQYARAYLHTEYDENDLTYFIEYNLKSMDLALRQLQKYIRRKVMEKQNLISLIQHENINERQAELLRSLIIDNQKSFTNKEVQTRFGVVYQTARTDLLGLQSLGYIKEKKFGKKLIYFKIDDFEKKLENVIGKDIEKPTVYEWDDADDAKSANYKMEKTATINNSGSISTTITEK
jgi:Fic family protein